MQSASSNRVVGDLALLDSLDQHSWDKAYDEVMREKYHKNTRNFSAKITAERVDDPQIYVVPRIRGGSSYKSIPLEGEPHSVQYCAISKGYPMQAISSFSLGPILGEGLNVVNAAFSKCVSVGHLEGGGKVNLRRKTFWQRSRSPRYGIRYKDDRHMIVDNERVRTKEWMMEHHDEWFPEWDKWRRSVAMCSEGSFHWTDSPVVADYHQGKVIGFVKWKKECYIKPAYELLPETEEYQFLEEVREKGRHLGLVHPKGIEELPVRALTEEYIRELYDDPHDMSCMPYVIAGKLLDVPVYED